MKAVRSIILLAIIQLFFISCSISRTGRKGDTSGTNATKGGNSAQTTLSIVSNDAKYLEKAAEAGRKQVRAGEIAQNKAQNDSVRRFAAALVKHHTAVNNELVALASSNKLYVPMDAPEDREILDLINEKSGLEFDRKYMKIIVRDYSKLVTVYERSSETAESRSIQNFFSKNLPIIKIHEGKAKSLLSSLDK